MKKYFLLLPVLFVLLWSSGLVFARRGGQSGGASRQYRPPRNVQNKSSSRQTRETAEKQAGKSKGEVEKEKIRTRTSESEAKAVRKLAGAEQGKGKAAENIGSGREHQQQLKVAQRQMFQEEAKYQQRKARIERIRQLATKAGNKNILGRLNKLQAKEQNRYESKRNRVRERMRTLQQLGEKSQGKTLQKTVEKSAAKEKAKAQQVGTKVEQKPK